ncbi:MAG: hypothetical protein EPO26_13175 [Chloroflexota bacterium]|nr:MAG: hypothetical protein EPO26_13175 [Chloroflexota bacterium]
MTEPRPDPTAGETPSASVAPPSRKPRAAGEALSPARQLANYLTGLRAIVTEATDSRRIWVRQIGILIQDVRNRPVAMVKPQADQIGTEQLAAFQEIRDKLEKLKPPPNCEDCQSLFNIWLDKHVAVCRVLIEFGISGDLNKLKAVQGLMSEGRADLERFQVEYVRLVTALRQRVDASRKKRAAKWPFNKAL